MEEHSNGRPYPPAMTKWTLSHIPAVFGLSRFCRNTKRAWFWGIAELSFVK
jgi:hypothetical protein